MADPTVNQRNVDEMRASMTELETKFASPSFCTAKWLQSTTLLYNGQTHSCHHPSTHKIPLEELRDNPSAIHNTNHKKVARAEMLAGERPKECDYCWRIEDLPGNHMSDRTYKSSAQAWSLPFVDRIVEAGATGDIVPSYLEVAFDSTCNFKCGYCSPDVSSKWMEEAEQHGPYPTSWGIGSVDWLRKTGRMPIPQREANPYVDAFWKWWPTLYPKLQTFRITGGEPLLSKNTWRVFDEIAKAPRRDFSLAVNTNMGVPDQFITKLIEANNRIRPHVQFFDVFTSLEAEGADADYIRFGMDYPKFVENCRRFLRETETSVRLNFMVTFNALSVPSFDRFLDLIWNLRNEFNVSGAKNRVPVMINYLRWPPFLSARVLPLALREEAAQRYRDFVAARSVDTSPSKHALFFIEEIDQIERLAKFMTEPMHEPDLDRDRRDFGIFTAEHDRRRGTDFQRVFPSLANFQSDCIDNAAAFAAIKKT